jgi:DNA-binding NarL/FixJ family response regulator
MRGRGVSGREAASQGPVGFNAESFSQPAITVAMGAFSELIGRGVEHVLREARRVRVVDIGDGVARWADMQRPVHVGIFDADLATPSAVHGVKAAAPTIGIVGLTHRPTSRRWTKAVGPITTCISKDATAVELLAAIYATAERASLLSSAEGEPESPDVGGIHGLTLRERQVLNGLVLGHTHREIANTLHITSETVRSHTANIRRKLGVQRNRQLIGLKVPAGLGTASRQSS